MQLETGRTHQIRVHMAALRHPCVGDLTYGADPTLAARLGLTRQWLHARSLSFVHPGTGDVVRFDSDYPADLAARAGHPRGSPHGTEPGAYVGILPGLARVDAKIVPRLGRGLARISRAVRPWRVRPLTVVAAVLVLSVVGHRAVAPGAARAGRPRRRTSTIWVGVRDGDSVPRYIDGSRAELAALTARDRAGPRVRAGLLRPAT